MMSNSSPNLITFIFISMLCATFLVTLVYLYYNWKNGLLGKLMSITLALISYGLFTSFNAAQGYFIYLPHLARTGYLVLLVITPLLYLILKKGLPNRSLKIYDALHFIPALIYFINYLPFFILSGEEKVALFTSSEFISFDEGWFFPKYLVIFLSLGQIGFYILLTCFLVVFPSRKDMLLSKEEKKFIYFFFMYLILLLIPPFTSVYEAYSGKAETSPIVLTYIVSQTIFFLLLWSQPQIIYPKKKRPSPSFAEANRRLHDTQKNKEPICKIPLLVRDGLDEEEKSMLTKILAYLENEVPYLKDSFSQEIICTALHISPYQLRKVLKMAFDLSFTDFVNIFRINYLIEMLSSSSLWRNYSSASLASSIGFKSSNSLYLCTNKLLKMTPKELVDQINSAVD